MRRTTSALAPTVLGAVLTASMVFAQQLPPPGGKPQTGATASGSATATESDQTSLYGMTAMRGARYLLRNGLDYLGYQQYERALKLLREAESRQKELNDAEKLALKRGIERAQRGLREASGAEPPYALSDQSRRSSGFTTAKPEPKTAANTAQPHTPDRKTAQSQRADRLGTESEDQGEPIRLASGEVPASAATPQNASPTEAVTANPEPTTTRQEDGQPAPLPELPKVPEIPEMSKPTDLRAMPGSDPAEAYRGASVAGRVGAPTRTMQPQSATQAPDSRDSRSREHLLAADQQAERPVEPTSASSDSTAPPDRPQIPLGPEYAQVVPGTAPAEITPPASLPPPGSATESQPPSQDQVPGSPPTQNTSTLKIETEVRYPAPIATMPAPASVKGPSPSTSELTPPSNPGSTPSSTANPTVVKLETVASQPSTGAVPKTSDLEASAPNTTANAASPSAPSPSSTAGPASGTTVPTPEPNPGTTDDLPPLPADLSDSAAFKPRQHTEPQDTITTTSAPGTAPSQPAASDTTDDLPPLPAHLGQPPAPNSALGAPTAPSNAALPTTATLSEPTAAPTGDEAPPAPAGRDVAPAATATPEKTGDENTTGNPDSHLAAQPVSTGSSDPQHSVAAPDPTRTSPGTDLQPLPVPDAATTTSPLGRTDSTAQPSPEQQPSPSAAISVGTVTAQPSDPMLAQSSPSSDSLIPQRTTSPSTLGPELQREVERIARMQEEQLHRQVQATPQPTPLPRETGAPELRSQTGLDISRAPSPAEARPIKAIPVPEDWVPLPPRSWSPQRKYWAAAATCHLPLYFQDAALERYGHSVEQFVGPLGRYLTYPVDDPTQSTQRNQILQPFFSAGLFALQIAALPYNVIMDPPWEAQYDLGYYRPGDNIPTDTYWFPLHGYGPPLRGSRY